MARTTHLMPKVKAKEWRALLGALAIMASSLQSATATAAPPATANTVQLGAGLRYGQELEDGALNPWGVGLGAGAGYTLPQAVYVGSQFDYFFGSQLETPEYRLEAMYWELLAKLGYDLGLSEQWVLRPVVAAGAATLRSEFCPAAQGTCSDTSSTGFVIAPGASALYLRQSFALGVDIRYDFVFTEESATHPDQSSEALVMTLSFGL